MPLELPDGQDVAGLTWDEFLEYFRFAWKAGQHVALIGMTGAGKSTFASGILDQRRYVLALDPKGGDATLSTLGYPRIGEYPLPVWVWEELAEGRPVRLIIGGIAHTGEELDALAVLLGKYLDGVFTWGGWTVYADEFQLLADRKMMGHGPLVERLLIAARSKGISVVTSYQAPAWVPTAASRQATWIALWPTRNLAVIKTLAEIVGRDWRLLWEVMRQVPPFHVLVIGPRPHDPMIITKAPRRN